MEKLFDYYILLLIDAERVTTPSKAFASGAGPSCSYREKTDVSSSESLMYIYLNLLSLGSCYIYLRALCGQDSFFPPPSIYLLSSLEFQ